MKQILIRFLFVCCSGLFSIGLPALSDIQPVDSVQVGRYTLVTTEPSLAQKDLLSVLIHVRFHKNILTVGEALEYLLLRSGYRLAKEVQESPVLSVLYQYPLPDAHRELGPITLRQGIVTLAGPVYQIVENPYQREITFQLVETHQTLVSTQPQEVHYDEFKKP